MGYTISVKLKNLAEIDRVLGFLNDNQDILKELAATSMYGENDAERGIQFGHGSQFAYVPRRVKHLISYGNFMIPSYIWHLCTFLAYKSSVRNKEGKPYIYYDDEIMLVDVVDEAEDWVTTHTGILAATGEPIIRELKFPLSLLSDEKKHIPPFIRRLNDRWNEAFSKTNV